MLAAIGAMAALAGLAPAAAGAASDSGNFPDKTIQFLTPFGAGGATDAVARAFAKSLQEVVGQAVAVVNRPGGNGAIAATEVANAKPDGYTIFLVTAGVLATGPLLRKVDYAVSDFTGIAGLVDQPYLLIVGPDSKWKSIKDLAKATGRVTYSITGVGNNTQISAGSFFKEAGVNATAVPTNSASKAIQSVAGGHTDAAAIDLNIAAPMAQSGKVRALATTSNERLASFPDVPTFKEAGFKDASNVLSRIGVVVPAKTPEDRVRVLREAAKKAIASPAFQKFVADNHLLASEAPDGERWIKELMPREIDLTRAVYKRLGVEMNGSI
jgi:tripartite-type tricarboxylate transporter receptor subunit TctC